MEMEEKDTQELNQDDDEFQEFQSEESDDSLDKGQPSSSRSRGIKKGKWTRQEEFFLRNAYGSTPDDELARRMSRSEAAIQKKAKELCLKKDKVFLKKMNPEMKIRMPRWSKDEEEKLRDLYPNHSNLEIARTLNRSVKSVVGKAHDMGLKKDKAHLRQMGLINIGYRYNKNYLEQEKEKSE